METKQFLESVLGHEGYYCIFAAKQKGVVKQKLCDSLDTAVELASEFDRDGWDTYFSLATFQTDRSREASNALYLRSFFLDIDCGDEKPFQTQADGYKALRAFCKVTNLPKPTVVSSGRGLHVYWRLTDPVKKEDWERVAFAFKKRCLDTGLQIDPAVPADAARVLRVPGTHHYKDNPPKEVQVVGGLEPPIEFAQFKDLFGEMNRPRTTKSVGPRSDLMTTLMGNFTSKFKNILIKTSEGKGCPQLHHVVTNQPEISEPLWRAGLSIASECSDGSVAIHRISNKHPNYSKEETEEKAALTKGPYLCTTFDTIREDVCPKCQHWGKIKSPIQLGKELEVVEGETEVVVPQESIDGNVIAQRKYTIPEYPEPYVKGKNGGVYKKQKNKEGDHEDVLVYHNPLYVVKRINDPEQGESFSMRLHLPRDGVREFTLPLACVASKDEFRKALAERGVAVIDVTNLMGYVMRWVNELQFKMEAVAAQRQFGWSEDNKSFAIGDRIFYADREEDNPPSVATSQYFHHFRKKGSLEAWKEAMQLYNRPGFEAYQYMFGLSLGAVLMEFMPLNGAGFHLWSDKSGYGKTTAMIAGCSVWGDPDLMMLTERDTTASKMNRAEVYKNLPIYMDELTNSKPLDLSDLAYSIPHGMQRNRMSSRSNRERVRGMPWKTLFGSTGNASVREKISLIKSSPTAEAQRIFEHVANKIVFDSKEETDQFSTAIRQNFGHAGEVYIQYVLKEIELVKRNLMSVQKRIDEAANFTAENRFWSAESTCVITGLIFFKQLGFIDWDLSSLFRWVVSSLSTFKQSVKDMISTSEQTLGDYLAQHQNNILRIKSGDKKSVSDMIIPPEASPRIQFIGRYEYDVKVLYLLIKPLKDWCTQQQISYSGLIEELRKGKTKARREKIRLARGTHMSLPPTDVWTLNWEDFAGGGDIEDTQEAT
jgi:hypothetical protein